MLDLLPNNLVAYIFEFLDLKDYNTVPTTCKRFFRIIHDHNKFWTRECLRHYISFDLEAYSEIYDSQDYRTYIQQKALILQRSTYKKLIAEGFNCKNTFAEVLSTFGSHDKVDAFLFYYYETLKQPLLPLANLKRETILCNAQTMFQNKLSEILYEDSGIIVKKISLPSESEEFINELFNYEEKIMKEAATCNKDNLVKARWYSYESKISESDEVSIFGEKSNMLAPAKGLPFVLLPSKSLDSTNDEVQSIKNNNTFCLLDMYNCICATTANFCEITSRHLNSLDNTYDLLAEYTARWNTFVSTMIELEQTFKAFTALMNKVYEHVFEGHPCFPKFSIWRLMTKIWMKEVFERSNLNFSLNESFLRILGNHREKNVKESLNSNFTNLQKIQENVNDDELPKSLYVNLKTKNKKNSTLQYQNAHQLQNITPVCFGSFHEIEKKLLSSFLQSILDVSLNEVNIHYLDCTDVPTNYPYHEVEEAFLQKSNEFYSDYQKLFGESPDYFCQFLKSDSSLISEILPQRTNIKLETIQIQNGFQFSKTIIHDQIDKVSESQLEKSEQESVLLNENVDRINEFIEAFLTETLEEHTRGTKEIEPHQDFYNLPEIDLEEDCLLEEVCEQKEEPAYCKYQDTKVFIKKLMKFLESSYPNFKSNFDYLQKRVEEFKRINDNDNYIKEHNISKNIPCEMGDVDRLFYDLDKNVDLGLLQKLSEDYNAGQNEEEKGLELPSLEDVLDPNMNEDFFDHVNLMDLNNIDLLGLENPTLRRAPF